MEPTLLRTDQVAVRPAGLARRQFMKLAVALAGSATGLSSLISACSQQASSSGESQGKSYAKPERLRIAYQPALGHRGVLMQATGYAERALKLPIEFVYQPSGPTITQLFAQDQLDIAYLGPFPALIGIDKGVPIRIIAANHWYGYSLIARKGIARPAEEVGPVAAARQFRGKVVGAFAKGSAQDTVCRWFFEKAGMVEGRDYTIRNYQGADAITLMRAGALDAFVEYFEWVAIVQDSYDVIVPGKDLWPGLDNVVVARKYLLDQYPTLVNEFLKVDADVARFAMAYPDEYGRLAAPVLKLPEGEASVRIRYDTHFCPSPDQASLDAIMALVPTMVRAGYLVNRVQPQQAFDFTYVRTSVGPAAPCTGHSSPDPALHLRVVGF